MSDEPATETMTTRLTRRQKDVLSFVSNAMHVEQATLIRRLIDRHLEPIAVRLGLDSRDDAIGDTRMADAVPHGMQTLTRSQICCMIDMFSQGWTVPDLGDFYEVPYASIEEALGTKTKAELRALRSKLRRAIGREQKRWQSHGEN
jgi:hypothetical protein